MPYVLYIASALGAVALYMMMPRRGSSHVRLGALLGAATLGLLWLYLADHHLPETASGGFGVPAMAYYYVFSAVAIGSAARVITHHKPVYAALWFVMVVLASAGLFVLLSAQFMAFAMVIIYGGAILVTYLFVIMLASQSSAEGEAPEYDRIAREPAAAVTVGFTMLAVLLVALFPTEPRPLHGRNVAAAGPSDAALHSLMPNSASAKLRVVSGMPAQPPTNTERVGVDLFRMHPLGIELAGVVLLVALIGAVVIARTRIESDAAAQ